MGFSFKKIVVILIFIISSTTYAYGESDKKTVKLTMDGLISKAEKYQIKIIDWRNLPKTGIVVIDLGRLKNQKSWLEFLKKQFPHCWAITHEGIKKLIYLLPQGVDAQFITKAKQFANKEDIDSHFASFKTATKINGIDILNIPEVIVLQTLASKEKTSTISYQRLVNPQELRSVYTFKVKYVESLQMMVPFEKNGRPVKGEMEGFSSFSVIYNFIVKRAKDLKAWRFNERVYLKLKNDNRSILMLNGTMNNMQIASRVWFSNVPFMDVYFTGNQMGFKSISKIHHPEGTIKLVDIASIH